MKYKYGYEAKLKFYMMYESNMLGKDEDKEKIDAQ